MNTFKGVEKYLNEEDPEMDKRTREWLKRIRDKNIKNIINYLAKESSVVSVRDKEGKIHTNVGGRKTRKRKTRRRSSKSKSRLRGRSRKSNNSKR